MFNVSFFRSSADLANESNAKDLNSYERWRIISNITENEIRWLRYFSIYKWWAKVVFLVERSYKKLKKNNKHY